jgi:hypothetical protein
VDIEDEVVAAVSSHPSVRSVVVAGSRAREDATRYSDWDFLVETDDFDAVAAAMPGLCNPLRPLGALWERTGGAAAYMLVVDGPTKIDLIFRQSARVLPPHVLEAETLAEIDAHFWDWTLWLTSKLAAGKTDLVTEELAKMQGYILEPMGIEVVPATLPDAVAHYLDARDVAERRFGIIVARELGQQVERVVNEVA